MRRLRIIEDGNGHYRLQESLGRAWFWESERWLSYPPTHPSLELAEQALRFAQDHDKWMERNDQVKRVIT